MITPGSWPTDPGECHDLLNRLAQQVEDLQAALDQAAKLHDQTVQDHQQTVDELRRQLELYRRYVFGPRRERLVEAPGQGHLFEFDVPENTTALPESPAPDLGRPHARRSRKPDYDRLPQVRIEHDVPEADKVCTHCGEPKARIGEDEARVLEFIPARFEASCPRVAQVCLLSLPRRCGGTADTAASCERLYCWSRSTCRVGRLQILLPPTAVSVRGYLDSSMVSICRAAPFVIGSATSLTLLKPLYELQKELVLKAPVIWTDDTHVTVLRRRRTREP